VSADGRSVVGHAGARLVAVSIAEITNPRLDLFSQLNNRAAVQEAMLYLPTSTSTLVMTVWLQRLVSARTRRSHRHR